MNDKLLYIAMLLAGGLLIQGTLGVALIGAGLIWLCIPSGGGES